MKNIPKHFYHKSKLSKPHMQTSPIRKTGIISKILDKIKPRFLENTPKPSTRVYIDGQATKPLDPRVLDAMLPYFTTIFGNPHSRTHAYGWNAENGVETARKQVASLINADPKEIIFTGSATESNNLALKGVSEFYLKEGKPVHIITSQVEHKSILDTCRVLEEKGVRVTYLPVDHRGLINLDDLKKEIGEDTRMVSIMAINSEMGAIAPLSEIGKICKEKGVLFHTDAVQGLNNIEVDVDKMKIDLLSLSGHKIYGPKGVGALYVRRRPRVRILPLIHGGGQERGLRSGTLSPPQVVGLGKAAEIYRKEMISDNQYIKKLSDRLKGIIFSKIPDAQLNGDEKTNHPSCVNISFPYVEGESLMMKLKNIALSSGSACTSSSLEPSYVLRALGKDDELAHSSIRFGLNKFLREEDIEKIGNEAVNAVKELRDMSPLYEMVKEGVDLKSIDWVA